MKECVWRVICQLKMLMILKAKIQFLNIRSISKHLIDLTYDGRLRKSDLICLTEKQIMQRSQTEKKFRITRSRDNS